MSVKMLQLLLARDNGPSWLYSGEPYPYRIFKPDDVIEKHYSRENDGSFVWVKPKGSVLFWIHDIDLFHSLFSDFEVSPGETRQVSLPMTVTNIRTMVKTANNWNRLAFRRARGKRDRVVDDWKKQYDGRGYIFEDGSPHTWGNARSPLKCKCGGDLVVDCECERCGTKTKELIGTVA